MVILMMVLTMVGCSTLDCPLNNTTYTKYKLMGKANSKNHKLRDKLKDKVKKKNYLYNKKTHLMMGFFCYNSLGI